MQRFASVVNLRALDAPNRVDGRDKHGHDAKRGLEADAKAHTAKAPALALIRPRSRAATFSTREKGTRRLQGPPLSRFMSLSR